MTAAYISHSYPIKSATQDDLGLQNRHISEWFACEQVPTEDKLSDNALCLQLLDRFLIHPHNLSEHFIGVLA